jgi:putative ABC transport system permease protein
MGTLLRDLRYSLRQLHHSPGFTLIAVLTIGLGIGANTAIFSVVDTVLLRPLEFDAADRLVRILPVNTATGERAPQLSYPTFAEIRDRSRSFAEVGAFRFWIMTLSGSELPESFLGVYVTERFLPALRVKPGRGRWFLPGSGSAGRAAEVVLSDAVWHQRFGGDPGVLNTVVTVEGRPATVVGILPPDFRFPELIPGNAPLPSREPDVYLPTGLDPEGLGERGSNRFWVVARLAPGISEASAGAELAGIASWLADRFPDYYRGQGLALAALKREVVGDAGRPLLVLLGAVGLVLLIACANVAGLLVARGAGRRREFALRRALGAAEGRLVRQVLTESVILALLGGTLGALAGWWGLDLIRALAPNSIPRISEAAMDGRILGYTVVISVASGVLFGLSPALSGARCPLAQALRDSERTVGGGTRLRGALVVLEVALSMVLLTSAGLLLRSFGALLRVEPGFDGRNVLTMLTILPPSRYPDQASRLRFTTTAVERLRALPGVQSAGAVNTLPLSNLGGSTSLRVEGVPDDGQELPEVGYRTIAGEYLESLRIGLVRGRALTDRDRAAAPLVALVNQAAARHFFGDRDPVGQRIQLGNDQAPRTIVGLVRDTQDEGLDRQATPLVYYPYAQGSEPIVTLVLRTAADPRETLPLIRRQLAAIDPQQPVFLVRTMTELEASTLERRRFDLWLLGGFAATALMLAAIGLYGVIAGAVTQRTREIGIRVALGAGPGVVQRLLLREGLSLALTGIGLGLVAALASSRLLQSQLVGVAPLDPAAIGGAVTLLLAVTVVATLIPARRATRVDPAVALRDG